MSYVVYDTQNGEILRSMAGAVPTDNQRLGDTEALLEINDGTDIKGMMVDTETQTLVEDPDYTVPMEPSDWATEYLAGNYADDSAALTALAEVLK